MADFVEEHIMRHEWTGNVDNISFEGLLVRCKDCKHYSGQFCNKNDIYPWKSDSWFCADGEKRE